MNTLFIGRKIIRLGEVGSTNSFAAELIKQGNVSEGTVVFASSQNAGRGQRATHWESEPFKNLTISIVLMPVFLEVTGQFLLNKAISLGVCEYVASVCGLEVKIKWPNDIYLKGRKAGGILIENIITGRKFSHTIAGIGLNVNQTLFSRDIPNSSSMRIETGKEFDLELCLEGLCSSVEGRYLQLRSGRKREINNTYLKHLYRVGIMSRYQSGKAQFSAKITGVTDMGQLTLMTDTGKIAHYGFKEVEMVL